MIRKIALLATAGMLAATVASAQTPPPGNVNPGSMKSGAEQTGAPNQPRSAPGGGMNGNMNGGAMKGTTGAAPRMDGKSLDGMSGPSTKDGTNATVKPGSQESGAENAGEPAPQRR